MPLSLSHNELADLTSTCIGLDNNKIFSVDLVDAQGGEIRATMFNDAAEYFYNVFENDKVYFVSKGTLKFKNKRFNPTSHEYELTLDQGSTVELCSDDWSIPHINFNFVPIQSVSECQADQVVDVIGIVSDCLTIN
jgi:replication factor A1